MAKSIRSTIKKRFRSQKRSDRISVEDERLARLAKRLETRQKAQAVKALGDDHQADEVADVNPSGTEEPMEIEAKKISTSGSRGSAREKWKGGKFLEKKRAKSVLSDRRRKKKN